MGGVPLDEIEPVVLLLGCADDGADHGALAVDGLDYLVAECGQQPEVAFDEVGLVQRDVEKVVGGEDGSEEAQDRDLDLERSDVSRSPLRNHGFPLINVDCG